MADSSWTVVDDRDPGIAYSIAPGALLWHGGVALEYDQTTTGLEAGDTATYYFNASSIGVFGTYGPTSSGLPNVAIYQVDDDNPTTVTGPVTQATLYRQNFWTSPQLPSLAPGAFHKLIVTATAPNLTLWLDYLAYPPDNVGTTTSVMMSPTNPASTTTASDTTVAIVGSPASGMPSASSANGTRVTSFAVATPTTTAEGQPTFGTSNTKNNIGAMVAGIVVGGVAFVLAIAAFAYIRRRRARPPSRERLIQEETDSPSMSENRPGFLIQAMPPQNAPLDAPSYSSLPHQENPSQGQLPRPLPCVPVRTFDGGVRLLGGPLEIPPEYQEHY